MLIGRDAWIWFIIAVIVHGGFVSHYTLIFTAERLDVLCVCVCVCVCA